MAFTFLEMNVSADDYGLRSKFKDYLADFPFTFGSSLGVVVFAAMVVEGFVRLSAGSNVAGASLLSSAAIAYCIWYFRSEDGI